MPSQSRNDARRIHLGLPTYAARSRELQPFLHIVAWLAYDDPIARAEFMHRYDGRAYPALVDHKDRLVRTPLHDAITDLMGTVTTARIYMQLDKEPAYSIRLMRGPDGIWRYKNARPVPIAGTIKPGLTFTAPPYSGAAMPILSHLTGGGAEAIELMQSYCADYETRRMMSHCCIIGRFLGSLGPTKPLPLHSPVRGQLLVNIDRSHGDGYTAPYAFYPHTVRTESTPGEKPRALFLAGADGRYMTAPLPYYVLPHIRPDCRLYVPGAATFKHGVIEQMVDYDEEGETIMREGFETEFAAYSGPRLIARLESLFRASLLPMIGVVYRHPADVIDPAYITDPTAFDGVKYLCRKGDLYCEFIAPSYHTKHQTVFPYVVSVKPHRRNLFPYLIAAYNIHDQLIGYTASKGLLLCLARLLTVESSAAKYRRVEIRRLLEFVGNGTFPDAVHLFNQHSIRLRVAEQDVLRQILPSGVELR